MLAAYSKPVTGDSIRITGVGQEATFTPPTSAMKRLPVESRSSCVCSADMVETRGVKGVECGVYAVLVRVNTVTGRRVYEVEADARYRGSEVDWDFEQRIGCIVAGAERGHQ